MKFAQLLSTAAVATLLLVASVASASITYDTSVSSWNVGTGNANDHFVVSTDNGIELGLRAITRHLGSIAPTGSSSIYEVATGPAAFPPPTYANWNFDFSIIKISELPTGALAYLDVDFDPAAGSPNFTPVFSGVSVDADADGKLQNSWNYGMGFLSTAATAASHTFDFNAEGEYSFRLGVKNANGATLNEVAMTVRTPNAPVVPEPATLSLLGLGMSGIAFLRRRKSQK